MQSEAKRPRGRTGTSLTASPPLGKKFENTEMFGQYPLQVNGFKDLHECLEAAMIEGEIESLHSENSGKSGQEVSGGLRSPPPGLPVTLQPPADREDTLSACQQHVLVMSPSGDPHGSCRPSSVLSPRRNTSSPDGLLEASSGTFAGFLDFSVQALVVTACWSWREIKTLVLVGGAFAESLLLTSDSVGISPRLDRQRQTPCCGLAASFCEGHRTLAVHKHLWTPSCLST